MNKKIKVIELLNKIANNEKLPAKIIFNTVVWKLMKDEKDYRSTHTQERLLKDDNWILGHLNVEVEILEDEEEIDIQGIKEMEYLEDYEADKTDIRLNRDKINDLVKAVKQLDKKINKE